MDENRHRTVSLMNDIHPEYVVNVAFGGAKDGIDGKVGRDGEPGKDGAPGEDGFSPIVEAFRNPDDTGIIVRVTDKDGTRETYVQDGTSSSGENEPVLYIENEPQYTLGYSILRYSPNEIPDGYDDNYLDSTFILQVVAIGHGGFNSNKRYSAYFAISFRHDVATPTGGELPAGITCTYLHGDFKPTFEIRKASDDGRVWLEFTHIGSDVQDAGYEDFEYGTDVAFYVSHYSGNIPYDEFASMFSRGRRINPLKIPASNYTYLVDVNRSELFNQRLDDVLRFRNSVTGDLAYTTDTSIRATDIEMSTDGDKPGKISLEAAKTINGQTRIQSGKIWLGDYNSSGDYEKLITLDAINNNWRTYQTIIENGELSLKDFDRGYRTVVISGTSSKPYIDMRNDSNSSTHSIKLQVNGDNGSTNILNGQIVLKDENGNKQIDISSRTNGKGIIKLSDKKIIESNGSVFKLYNNSGDNIFNISDDGLDYPAGGATFIHKPYILSTTAPTLPDHPEVEVDSGDFYPTGGIDVSTLNGSGLLYHAVNNYAITIGGRQYLRNASWMALQNNGNNVVYSSKDTIAWYEDGGYSTKDRSCSTTLTNSGYRDIIVATVNVPLPTQSGEETGWVNYCNCRGYDTMLIESRQDDNGDPYDTVDILVQGDTVAIVNGQSLTVDDRLCLNEHKLSDIVTYNQAFMNGGNLVLKNNTIFTADEEISNKSFSYTGGDCIIEFSTPASGSITISFPMTITFDEYPTFGNDEHWIIGVRDGWAVWTKYDLSQ